MVKKIVKKRAVKKKKPVKKYKTHILKVKGHDPAKELDFEVRHQMTLTIQDRFDAMIKLSLMMIKLARQHGYSRASKIVKRT